VSQAVVIGDKRKFPVLLVVPNWESVEKWAKDRNLLWTERRQLLSNPEVRAMLEGEVRGKLGHLAKFEMPKKIAFLEHDFSIERGELTPKLSVKRRVIDKLYKDLIDGLYATRRATAPRRSRGGPRPRR
jgi:long-chain acyl-CoA synthetase